MSIAVACGQCGKQYNAPDTAAGRKLKCKACGGTIGVPQPVRAAAGPSRAALTPPRAAPPTLPPAHAAPAYSPPQQAPAAAAIPRGTSYLTAPRIPVEKRDRDYNLFGRIMWLGFTGVVLLSLALLIGGKAIDGFAKPALIILVLIWTPIAIANAIWTIIIMCQESVVCLILAMFVPFYSLYYLITRWDTMHRPFAVQVCTALFMIGGMFALAPIADGKNGSSREEANGSYERRDYGETAYSGSNGSSGVNNPGVGRPRRPGEPYQPPPGPQVSPEQQRLDAIVQQVEAFARRDWNGSSREQAEAEYNQLTATVASEKAQVDNRVPGATLAWSRVDSAMSSLRNRFSSLPSEKPDTTIFQEPTPGVGIWSVNRSSALADEVSYRNFRIRPPADALLDLTSSESDDQRGLVWTAARDGGWTFSIRTTPKANPRQKQPWFAGHHFAAQAADREKLLWIDSRENNYAWGTVNGMMAWRVAPKQSSSPVRFYYPAGNDWLLIEIVGGSSATGRDAFEDAAKSVRPAKPGEAKADPFAPAAIARRMPDQPEQALKLLRPHRSAVEPFMLPYLTHTNPAVARAAANYLVEFGTAAALPALRKAAEASDAELSTAARVALRRLAPDEFDAAAELLIDLKSTEAQRRSEAVVKVAMATPASASRQEVAKLLEDLLLADDGAVDRATVGKALAVWYGDRTVTRLLPILSQENADAAKRDAAIDVIAATKDKAGAAAIIRWLLKEPDKTAAAMIRMGPVAEESVLKLYNSIATTREEQHVAVRANCVKILCEVGATNAALQVLSRASKDPRDVGNQELAKQGIESVKGRMTKK